MLNGFLSVTFRVSVCVFVCCKMNIDVGQWFNWAIHDVKEEVLFDSS